MSVSTFSSAWASDNQRLVQILFLHKYDHKAAAFRYRFFQYFMFLEKYGFEIKKQSLLNACYLENKFAEKSTNFIYIIIRYLIRFIKLIFLNNSLTVVYMEVFPYLPFFIEYYVVLKRRPYIIDLDDAIYLNYINHKSTIIRYIFKNKYAKIFSGAKCIMAGNEYLASYVKQFNSNVVVVPTVVDLDYYTDAKRKTASSKVCVIGWMGSPSTAKNLLLLQPVFQRIENEFHCHFLFVGSGKMNLHLKNVEYRPWVETNEIVDLKCMDIGIMPLEDNAWNRGKCGFKLIQYMACGIPTVGSPVGVNSQIIHDQINGLTAISHDDWYKALSFLIKNPKVIADYGLSARKTIELHYSFKKTAPVLLDIIRHSL